MSHALPPTPVNPHARLRARCAEAALLAWRFTPEGEPLEAPNPPGLAGVWIRSRAVVQALAKLCPEAASKPSTPMTQQVLPGLWAIALPALHRGRVVELTVITLLTSELLTAPEFERAASSAGLDPGAARRAMTPLADAHSSQAPRLARMLHAMAGDLDLLDRQEDTLSGFTSNLASAYEHIELLADLARSMTGLANPRATLLHAIAQIRGASGFRWLALSTPPASVPDAPIAESLLVDGAAPVDAEAIRLVCAHLSTSLRDASQAHILDSRSIPGTPLPDSQLVAMPLGRPDQRAALLLAGDKQGPDPQVSTYDTRILDTAGAFLGAFVENASLLAEQNATFLGFIRALTSAVDAKDRYTMGHSDRVAHLAAQLARAAGLDDATANRVHLAGLLHDVGKIGVPESVLCKPGKLTDEEFDHIKRHPRLGHDILRGIPQLADILPGVLWHHERWDGRGYPDHLSGERIPLLPRLIAVADTFDAMSSNRSYRPAMPRQRVLAEIARCAGSQLDPALAPLFTTLDFTEYDRMAADHAPQAKHAA